MPALPSALDASGVGRPVGLTTGPRRTGIHGDSLADGKLDLPELLEMPSAADLASARTFIANRRWREASTYRHTAPHEYTVREWRPEPQDQSDFDAFVTAIRRFGYADFYYRVRHLYWAIDKWKYWTMGWPVAETVVVNRARVDAAEPWNAAPKA